MRDRLAVLELADRLGNVTDACRQAGWSRDSFYRFRRWYERGGKPAIDGPPRAPRAIQLGPEVEQLVLAFALDHPRWGRLRVARRLSQGGVPVKPASVRAIWRRHGIGTVRARVAARRAVDDPGRALREVQETLRPTCREAGPRAVSGVLIERPRAPVGALGPALEIVFVEPYSGLALATMVPEGTRNAAVKFLRGRVADHFAQDGIVVDGAIAGRDLPSAIAHAVARAEHTIATARRNTLRAHRYTCLEAMGAAYGELLAAACDRPAPGPRCLGRSPRATLLLAVDARARWPGEPRARALPMRCATPAQIVSR